MKYSFSLQERYAVYTVHGERCYLCKKPIDLKSMQVDHILPEYLEKKSDEFQSIKNEYGLDDDFNINCFENWLPSCPNCNSGKGSRVFKPVPAILTQLDKARSKAIKTEELCKKTHSKQKINRALNIIMTASTSNQIDDNMLDTLYPLIDYHSKVRNKNRKYDDVQLTPKFNWNEDKKNIIKNKDIVSILKIFNYIDVTRINYILERYTLKTIHSNDMMYMSYLGEVIIESYINSTPHEYDKKLRKIINKFIKIFFSCTNNAADLFNQSEYTKICSIMKVSSCVSYEHWNNEYQIFQTKVKQLSYNFHKLIIYIRKNYWEINLEETSDVASENFSVFLDSIQPSSKHQS